MTTEEIVKALNLEAHPEGGFFRRTYTSGHQSSDTAVGRRAFMSSIYYLLGLELPIGRMHSNRSDIVHYWQAGGALRYTLVSPEGDFKQVIMGNRLLQGEQLQLTVPGGWWKASELISGDYGLISEAVCPSFDYADHQFADPNFIQGLCPLHWAELQHLC